MTQLHTTTSATEAAMETVPTAHDAGSRRAPGPHGNLLLGSARALQGDPLEFYTDMAQRYGEVVRTRLLFWPTYLVFHPDGVRRMQAGLRALNTIVQRLIEERRKPQAAQHDLLSLLLEAQDEESGQGLSDRQVRDEVFTLLFAGHETTANALTWALYLLSQHPEVEQRLYEEVDTVLAGQAPTVEDLRALPYTRMVLEETLRLYPPGATIPRRAIAADVIGDFAIPANSLVFITPYVTHRHPDFWEQPEVFDPERFTPERVAARHRFAYFPFGGGPHLCIGQHFAMMEAQLALAMIVQSYRLSLVPGQRIEPKVMVTIRPCSGMKMRLYRREFL